MIVFQDPRAHINPLRRIGDFICEGALAGGGHSKAAALTKATTIGETLGSRTRSGAFVSTRTSFQEACSSGS